MGGLAFGVLPDTHNARILCCQPIHHVLWLSDTQNFPGGTMYAAIRKYQFNPASVDEINRQINDGFLPIISQSPGFIAYYWIYEGNGIGASFGLFTDEAGAVASSELAADFIQKNMASLLGKPEIVKGEVMVSS
jgi:hypothetical protein